MAPRPRPPDADKKTDDECFYARLEAWINRELDRLEEAHRRTQARRQSLRPQRLSTIYSDHPKTD